MITVLHYCFGAKFLDGYSLVIHLSSEKSPSLRGNLSINGQFSSICHFPLPAVKFPEGTLILSLSHSHTCAGKWPRSGRRKRSWGWLRPPRRQTKVLVFGASMHSAFSLRLARGWVSSGRTPPRGGDGHALRPECMSKVIPRKDSCPHRSKKSTRKWKRCLKKRINWLKLRLTGVRAAFPNHSQCFAFCSAWCNHALLLTWSHHVCVTWKHLLSVLTTTPALCGGPRLRFWVRFSCCYGRQRGELRL